MGCQTPSRLSYCDLSIRNVCKVLDIELEDLKDAGCCGYPIRFISAETNDILAARNLALADRQGLDLMMLCNSCYATLHRVKDLLTADNEFRRKVNASLANEGLRYEGNIRLVDVLQVYHDDIGLEKLRSHVRRELKGLRVAVHYGCHLLRPSRVVKFDNAENPRVLDDLVRLTGAESVYWPLKLWCCGCPTLPFDETMALGLARRKLLDAKDAGADCMVTTCPSCHLMFDTMQPRIERMFEEKYDLPVLYYSQLLGLALGLSFREVGLNLNRVPIDSISHLL
jgi:heterodisulfide reductase subunit B